MSQIIMHNNPKPNGYALTANDLRDLLDGETLELGSGVSIYLDPKLGPFELGILVGKSLRDREKIKDAETRLDGNG
jgi:hypothetical protein